jgi:hypothetical protein
MLLIGWAKPLQSCDSESSLIHRVLTELAKMVEEKIGNKQNGYCCHYRKNNWPKSSWLNLILFTPSMSKCILNSVGLVNISHESCRELHDCSCIELDKFVSVCWLRVLKIFVTPYFYWHIRCCTLENADFFFLPMNNPNNLQPPFSNIYLAPSQVSQYDSQYSWLPADQTIPSSLGQTIAPIQVQYKSDQPTTYATPQNLNIDGTNSSAMKNSRLLLRFVSERLTVELFMQVAA